MILNNLKSTREKMNMSQVELSEKSGISRQTIIDIENGEVRDMKMSTMVKLSSALNSDPFKIFYFGCSVNATQGESK